MKKYYIGLCVVFSLFFISSLYAKETLVNNDQYTIVNITNEGEYETKEEYSTYIEAKQAFEKERDELYNAAIVHKGKIINIEYGLVLFSSNNSCTVNTNYINVKTNERGYTNGCYGRDAAFIDTNEDASYMKFMLSGVQGWAKAEDLTILPLGKIEGMTSYKVTEKKLYHQIKTDFEKDGYSTSIYLGKAPTSLRKDHTYYSYDGHYFYENTDSGFMEMIEDYRKQSYEHAVNASSPYYNYYQYLSHRSTSQYTSEDLQAYLQDHLGVNRKLLSFQDKSGNGVHNVLTDSMLYGTEKSFIQYQNEYGANALMMLSLAMNESAIGRSALAFTRNNLFGHAAFDSDVESNASRYLHVASSIASHAKYYISRSYLHPDKFQYHGGYFGNKASGMNVSYASDPYWGEKAAQYYAYIDDMLGNKDENAYTIGIKEGIQSVYIYEEASYNAKILYETGANEQYAFILLEKVSNAYGTWYKVQMDLSNDADGLYSFRQNVGYVKADHIDTILNEDQLKEKIYYRITFEGNGGTFADKQDRAYMEVLEGMYPIVDTPVKQNAKFIGWNTEVNVAKQDKTYVAQYKGIKELVMLTEPQRVFILDEYLNVEGGKVSVVYDDGTIEEIDMDASMVSGYDRKKVGLQTLTLQYEGGELEYEVEVQTPSVSKEDLYIQLQDIIGQLKEKDELTHEERDQLKILKKNIQESTLRLSVQDIRMFDTIYQMFMKPQIATKEIDETIGISGLSLALEDEQLARTIDIEYLHSVERKHKQQLEKVALVNGYQVIDYFHMEVSQQGQHLQLQSPIVVSMDKPKQENMQFQVLVLKGDAVISLPTTQSENKIMFESDIFEDFVIVAKEHSQMNPITDVKEVNIIQRNGDVRRLFVRFGPLFLAIGIVFWIREVNKRRKR